MNEQYPIKPAPVETIPLITSNPFWPSVNPAQIRLDMNIGKDTTTAQFKHDVIEAVALVNQLLRDWRNSQQINGIEHISNVDPENSINGLTVYEIRYIRAVSCFSKAATIQRYIDYDSTAKAEGKAEPKEAMVWAYFKDGHAAISDILGHARIQSDLV